MAPWSDKVVVVTGASKRVGRSIALTFGRAGADVIVHFNVSQAEAVQVVTELHALGRARSVAIQADLADAASARSMCDEINERFSGIDVLVNSAASFFGGDFLVADDQTWESAWQVSLATNLVAPARLVRLLAPALKQRSGAVVNLHDIAAETHWSGYVQHGCAKAGLAHLTRCLAVELAPSVRVCGVMPSIAVFPPNMPEPDQKLQIDRTLLGRPGNEQQIADAVLFVAGAKYMTGAHVAVDGGWSVKR